MYWQCSLKYSCYFFLCVTFTVLNVVSRLRACSEASLATFRFFTQLWAVIQPLFFCQDIRSPVQKQKSTFKSWSGVQEIFSSKINKWNNISQKRNVWQNNFITLLGVMQEYLSHCTLFTQGNRVTKNDKETKHCGKYKIYTEKPADPARAPNSDLDLHKILKKDHNLLQAD